MGELLPMSRNWMVISQTYQTNLPLAEAKTEAARESVKFCEFGTLGSSSKDGHESFCSEQHPPSPPCETALSDALFRLWRAWSYPVVVKRDPNKDGESDEVWDGPLATDGRKKLVAKKVATAKIGRRDKTRSVTKGKHGTEEGTSRSKRHGKPNTRPKT